MSNLLPVTQPNFTPEQMHLITSTIAKGATSDELKLFLYRCQNLGLDPLKPGQIYFIKYGTGPGTIVVGIEGFRARAGKTGKLSGIKRGAIKDPQGSLIGAWAEVYRSDWKEPAREEVPLSEYNAHKDGGYCCSKKVCNWKKMPETMIKKVAEAAALRMAFPDDLGGVYTKEEMDQAKGFDYDKPGPDDGIQTEEYVVKYGPCAKKKISECDPAVLREYILEREESYKRNNNKPGEWFLELLRHAEPLIAEYENSDVR